MHALPLSQSDAVVHGWQPSIASWVQPPVPWQLSTVQALPSSQVSSPSTLPSQSLSTPSHVSWTFRLIASVAP